LSEAGSASLSSKCILPEMKKSAFPFRNVLLSLAAAGLVCAALPKPKRIRRGQVAVITGGSSGLGLAIAHELGRAGLRLVLAAHDAEQLAAARQKLLFAQSVMSPDDVVTVPCDIGDNHQAWVLKNSRSENLRKFIAPGCPTNDFLGRRGHFLSPDLSLLVRKTSFSTPTGGSTH
jgi:short chain dehydrogenase